MHLDHPCHLIKKVLTSERHVIGGGALWRYITRAMLVARLDKLNTVLRGEEEMVEEFKTQKEELSPRPSTAQRNNNKLSSSLTKDEPQFRGIALCTGENSRVVGLEEREKELIRMKIEKLDAARIAVEREHALYGGSAAATASSGGGGGGR